jgi:hypothetical protein
MAIEPSKGDFGEQEMRRLKMKNYGKWFLQPKDFNFKVKKLNKNTNKHGLTTI